MRFARGRNGAWGLKLGTLACILALSAFPQKQKKDVTQVLQLPKDLPLTVEGDPRHLTFLVTPLSSKGLLSKQVRDALSSLFHESHGDTILKIRAFVAGSGDSRRVRDIVSEVFTDRKQPLPVLSLVQSGGLPDEAQVVLEGIASARKEVNPAGLAFLSAQSASAEDPAGPVAPLAEKSMTALRTVLQSVRSEPPDVVRLSCFVSTLDEVPAMKKSAEQAFPAAAINFVQAQRSPARSQAACEAVAKLRWNPGAPLTVLNPEGLPAEAGTSAAALVSSPKVVLTGTQLSFGFEEKDARLAFDRVAKELGQSGVGLKDVAFAHFYPLATRIAAQIDKVRADFFNASRPPGTSLLLFEGLPSMNAGFAMDVVAVK